MDSWSNKMAQHVKETPPSCLSGFSVAPSDGKQGARWVGWTLSCPCGGNKGKLLGHALKARNPAYDGPPRFVSPLAFFCPACGRTTVIIDTELHGYHSETNKTR